MTQQSKRLSDVQVRNFRWTGKTGRGGSPVPDVHADGNGLYLSVGPNGKSWILRLYVDGKERRVGLGSYEADGSGVTLRQAREAADRERLRLRDTGDTQADERRRSRAESPAPAPAPSPAKNDFEAIAREWHKSVRRTLTPKHAAQCIATLEQHAFPAIGSKLPALIRPSDVLKGVLEPMLFGRHDDSGKAQPPLIETATRVLQRTGAVFEYANLYEVCTNNPVPACRREFAKWKKQLLKTNPKTNFPSLADTAALAQLIAAIDAYPGLQTRLALKIILYTAVRSGELRGATWDEFDLDGREPLWTIPAKRMKARRIHHVPLAPQVLPLLRELKAIAGASDLVVPGRSDDDRPISDMTLSMALRRMGFENLQTVHGLRSVFSTQARENALARPEVIEAQLAHVVRDATEAAYNKAFYLPERRQLMTRYADFIDSVGAGPSTTQS